MLFEYNHNSKQCNVLSLVNRKVIYVIRLCICFMEVKYYF